MTESSNMIVMCSRRLFVFHLTPYQTKRIRSSTSKEHGHQPGLDQRSFISLPTSRRTCEAEKRPRYRIETSRSSQAVVASNLLDKSMWMSFSSTASRKRIWPADLTPRLTPRCEPINDILTLGIKRAGEGSGGFIFKVHTLWASAVAWLVACLTSEQVAWSRSARGMWGGRREPLPSSSHPAEMGYLIHHVKCKSRQNEGPAVL